MTPEITIQKVSLFSAGGPFLWLLILISAVAFIFVLERILYLHKGQIRALEFLEGIKNNLRQSRVVEALTACEETPGPVARVIKAILLRASDGESRMRGAAEEAAILEVPVLERRIGTIGAIAKLTPLVGLAGTTFSFYRAFSTMQNQGHYANADAFAGDIASAIIVTAVALVITALAHISHHFLCGRIRAITHDIEVSAHAIIQFIAYELPEDNVILPKIQNENAADDDAKK